MVDIAISTDVFLGKRVLQFDSPDKDPEAKQSIYNPVLPSMNHDFEDDDASEWSLYVNLGSPEVEKERSTAWFLPSFLMKRSAPPPAIITAAA